MHSNSLTWEIIKPYHSFLVKRNNVVFSSEPNNLVQKHMPKFSGFMTRSVGVSTAKNGVCLSLKKSKVCPNKVAKNALNATFKSGPRRSAAKATKAVQKYRPDLAKLVGARVARLTRKNKTTTKAKKARYH